MRSLPVYVWRQLQMAVMPLNEKSSMRDVLGVVLLWGRSNHKYLTAEPFSSYGFEELLRVKEDNMPVEYSAFLPSDIIHFRKGVLHYQSKDGEYIARFLRDTVEALITVEVEMQCSGCASGCIQVFIGKYNGMLAYQCKVCGYSQYIDGSRVEAGGMDFVSEEKLRGIGLIQ